MQTLIHFLGQYSWRIRWLYWKLTDNKYLWGIFGFTYDSIEHPSYFQKGAITEDAADEWLENISLIYLKGNKMTTFRDKFIKHSNGICWTTKCFLCGELTNPNELVYTERKTGAAFCKECIERLERKV